MRTQITSVALQALMIGKSRRICFQVQKSYGARIQLPFLLIIAQKNSKDSFHISEPGHISNWLLSRFRFRQLLTGPSSILLLLVVPTNCAYKKRQLFLLSQYGHPPASRLFWRTNTGRSLKDALH